MKARLLATTALSVTSIAGSISDLWGVDCPGRDAPGGGASGSWTRGLPGATMGPDRRKTVTHATFRSPDPGHPVTSID